MGCGKKDLYRSFQAWSLEGGEKYIMKQKEFTANLLQKGFIEYLGHGGILKIRGIGLRTKYSEEIIKSGENSW